MGVQYKAADFISMKSRVKTEVQRRKHIGPIDSYGGPSYDYSVQPAVGVDVKTEHYNKIAEPLRAINTDGVAAPTVIGAEVGSVTEPTVLDAKITLYASKPLTAASNNTGCGGSCTGLCSTTCTGSCTGNCTGSCTGCSGCSGTCSGTCTGGCTGCSSCSGGCTGCGSGCSGGCTGCGSGCSGGCESRCTGQCVSSCGGSCSGQCVSSSSGQCQSPCSKNCSGLGDYQYYKHNFEQLQNASLKEIDYACQFSLEKLEKMEGGSCAK